MDAIDWVFGGLAKAAVVNVLGDDIADRVSPDAMLADDLGADSLDMLDLQALLIGKGVQAPDEAFTQHMRVSDVAKLFTAPPPLKALQASGAVGGWHPGDEA